MRVSTGGTYSTLLTNLQRGQTDMQKWGAQIATNKVATDLKGFGVKADYLTATKTAQSKVQSYIEQNKLVMSKLEMQDSALVRAADAGSSALLALQNAVSTESGAGLMTKLNGVVAEVSDAMNTRFQGRYLFAGGNNNTAPVTVSGVNDLTIPVTAMFTNGQTIASSQTNETSAVETGFLADAVASPLFTVLKDIKDWLTANVGADEFPSPLTDTQTAFLKSKFASLETVSKDMIDVASENGTIQARVESIQSSLTDTEVTMKFVVGDIVDADIALAKSRLDLAKLSLEFSSQIFTTLSQSSLLNALR